MRKKKLKKRKEMLFGQKATEINTEREKTTGVDAFFSVDLAV